MTLPRVGHRRVLREGAAVAWLLACGAGFLAPALSHGSALGPYDLLHVLGVTSTAHPTVHNAVASDQIQQFIPWQVLTWLQVRAGDVPLWQPANLLGMPLAFNFQSAPFSLAVAVSYAFPLALAHTATIAAQLALAGTGTYVLCRMLRLGVLPSVMGATIFELCGGLTIWLGYYEAGCCCLLGWALAASVALLRGRRRAVPVALLAVVLALAFAAGEPQVDAFVVALVGVYVLVALARGWAGTAPFAPVGPNVRVAGVAAVGGAPSDGPPALRAWRRRALLDHVLALLAAIALVAPIYLPAVQVLLRSARVRGPFVTGLPPHDVVNLILPWYNGVPTNLASVVGPDNLYVASVSVGAIGLVLALSGLAAWRRRPEVLAFGLATVGSLVILYVPPFTALLRRIPKVQVFRAEIATTFLDFSLAMLAAFGADALIRIAAARRSAPRGAHAPAPPADDPWTRRIFVAGTVAVALVLGVLGTGLVLAGGHLTPAQRGVRTAGFLWPAIGAGACAVVVAAQAGASRRGSGVRKGAAPPGTAASRAASAVAGRWGVGALVALEAAALVVSGAWFLSSTSAPLKVTPGVAALQRIVGTKLVGMGRCPTLTSFPRLGIMPVANAAYGVNEFTDYDPIMTVQYYESLAGVIGTPRTPPPTGAVLCPALGSARAARYYGVSYVLEPGGRPGPAGTRLVARAHGEGVFAVPDSGRATLVPLGSGRNGAERAGQLVQPATESIGGTWRVDVRAPRRSLLVLRVTSLPGWEATIDGRPLRLRTFGSVMLSAVVPAGRHVVLLRYWPRLWSAGLVLAAIAAAALAGGLVVAGYRRLRAGRVRPRDPAAPGCADEMRPGPRHAAIGKPGGMTPAG